MSTGIGHESPPLILAIASGKGGTGKTTLAVNLASMFGSEVQLLDCDVEEPNAHLFLPGTAARSRSRRDPGSGGRRIPLRRLRRMRPVLPVPRHRLVRDQAARFSRNVSRLRRVRPGLSPKGHPRNGSRASGSSRASGPVTSRLVQGRLNVGAPMAPPLIRAVKARLRNGMPAILDAPPGTSCPVIATIRGADFVVLVTEPTPFGLHDLKLAVDMVRELRIPFGVVVNRVGIGDDRVHVFCRTEGIRILLEIPDDRRIAEAVSRGRLVVEALPENRPVFRKLLDRIAELQPTPKEAIHADL